MIARLEILLLINKYVVTMLQELVVEKETRIRETMLMMGFKQWVLWSTWYLKQFLFLMIPVIVICILLKVSNSIYTRHACMSWTQNSLGPSGTVYLGGVKGTGVDADIFWGVVEL